MLAPCTSCRRHVRADEPQCPFCGGAIGASTNRPVPRAPRVAILFAGALGIAGCSGSDQTAVAPPYGAPAPDSALVDTSVDSAKSDTNMPTDSATPTDSAVRDTAVSDTAPADSGSDAEEDTWSPVPPYGAPLLDSGSDE